MKNQMISLKVAPRQLLVRCGLLLVLALLSGVSSEQYGALKPESGAYIRELEPDLRLAELESLGSVLNNDEEQQLQRQLQQQLQQQEIRPSVEDLLVSSLIGQLEAEGEQERLQQLDAGQSRSQSASKRRQDDSLYYYYDVNSHLPPTSPFGEPDNLVQDEGAPLEQGREQSIRGPVNDPEEFEAELGQMIDLLNHKMSNSAARQQLLLSLMNESSASGGGAGANEENEASEPANSSDNNDNNNNNNLASSLDKLIEERARQESRANAASEPNEEPGTGLNSIEASTSEYIDHPLALFGHQLVQGGAGEGRQLLGPEGTFENIQVIKTDSAIPSYCDPPNPCPLGRTAKDGCLENFVNSASFSREYQAKQRCSCDNEHSLFNCASPAPMSNGSDDKQAEAETETGAEAEAEAEAEAHEPATAKLDTLARTIQNRYGNLESVRRLISEQQEQQRQQQQQQARNLALDNEHDDSSHLARSARKWSAELNYHKMDLD